MDKEVYYVILLGKKQRKKKCYPCQSPQTKTLVRRTGDQTAFKPFSEQKKRTTITTTTTTTTMIHTAARQVSRRVMARASRTAKLVGPNSLLPSRSPTSRFLHDGISGSNPNPVSLQMINYALSHARSLKSGLVSSPLIYLKFPPFFFLSILIRVFFFGK